MDSALHELKRKFPGRERQLEQLYNLYGHDEESFVDSLFIYGSSNTGKSAVLTSLLTKLQVKHVVVDLIECYSPKVFFETILNRFTEHKIDPYKGQPYAKADNMMDFIFHLKRFCEDSDVNKAIIVLDKAEQLRDSDNGLLPAFLRLKELSGLEISIILISQIVYEKYMFEAAVVEPIKIQFPRYTKTELQDVVVLDYDVARSLVLNRYHDPLDLSLEFYKNYLNVFLSVFYRGCRDLAELRYTSKLNFVKYCEPIATGHCKLEDSIALWRNIAPVLKSSLEGLYSRIASSSDLGNKTTKAFDISKANVSHSLELPYYAKYLLIAAYLASYNPIKEDKRLFMKYHKKKTKSVKDLNAKKKTSEQLNTQLGPKPFTFDRLLAIFYSILGEEIGFNNNLLVQVSSLVELKLLSAISDSSLDGHKYKCTVGFDCIQNLAKMLDFNITKYLTDFN